MCRVTNHQTRLPRATSSLALNASRDGASTASLGNLFQCVTTLCEKSFLLISNLNLPCLSLKPFPLILSLFTVINSHSPSFLYVPFKYWRAIRDSTEQVITLTVLDVWTKMSVEFLLAYKLMSASFRVN